MESVVFHIIESQRWVEARQCESYAPASYVDDGFIHLSKLSQILRPANLLYRGQRDLVLLVIEVQRLLAPLVYEPGSHGEDELFPHLYGRLNVDAVVQAIAFPCRSDGSFALPEGLDQTTG